MTDNSGTFLRRLLNAAHPGAELTAAVLQGEGGLPCFLANADAIPAGPPAFHSGSVLAHLARCMDAVAGDPMAVWMALAHDAGKLTTPSALWPHHYGHERRGEKLIAVWAQQLRLPEALVHGGRMAARLHMKAGRYARLRPAKRYRLLKEVAESGYATAFWRLIDADTKSCISARAARDWERVCAVPVAGLSPEALEQRRIDCLR